jgi:Stress up-regulated Nod 19
MSRYRTIVASVIVVLSLLVPASASAESTKTIRYGPFTVPGGTHTMPGMKTALRLGVSKPCSECYITSFTPDLTYASGTFAGQRADMATGMMLHHAVFASQWRSDATCSGSWLGLAGERFFASGDERSRVKLLAGYGYRMRWYDQWNLLVDLMNMSAGDKQVYLTITFTLRAAYEPVRPVKPVWLDIDNCGDSEYSVPVGYDDHHWDWQSTMDGTIVGMIGHQHHTGVRIDATNETQGGSLICSSTVTEEMDHVVAMSPCTRYLPATIHRGEVIRLHSVYNSDIPRSDVMGIMLGYVHRTG